MHALVTYQYYTDGEERENRITSRTDETDVDLNRLMARSHMVGDTVTLAPEEDEEEAIERFGKDPRDYVIRKCVHTLTQVTEYSPSSTFSSPSPTPTLSEFPRMEIWRKPYRPDPNRYGHDHGHLALKVLCRS